MRRLRAASWRSNGDGTWPGGVRGETASLALRNGFPAAHACASAHDTLAHHFTWGTCDREKLTTPPSIAIRGYAAAHAIRPALVYCLYSQQARLVLVHMMRADKLGWTPAAVVDRATILRNALRSLPHKTAITASSEHRRLAIACATRSQSQRLHSLHHRYHRTSATKCSSIERRFASSPTPGH